ncbi:PREDICTED: cation/H(+) antiporter 1-like [Nelumbo nucifera]|uniref:Cation/H(+) antiporter 1-like n=1 Tax=Nelumbo nucifera TaxID=4432 RepID=A0A1U8ATY4_NELNU|nr:PREDICTED: cation/H(+) antiporter 1-like [Nelumbo nucifera]
MDWCNKQTQAGLVLGPSGLSRIKFIREYVFQDQAGQLYVTVATFSRILFMFLIGLEMDLPYLVRTLRVATLVAYGGAATCCFSGAIVSPFLYNQTHAHGSGFKFAIILMMLLANTASPVVVRVVAELKLATSEVGRLAISASIINDITCLLGIAFISAFTNYSKPLAHPKGHTSTSSNNDEPVETDGEGFGERFFAGIVCLIILGGTTALNRILSRWLSRRNHHRKYITNLEVAFLLMLTFAVSILIELFGYNSMIASFLLGLFFPRDGKTTRTLLQKLTYPVHHFILPFYFGYTGFQADLSHIVDLRSVLLIITIVCLSVGGKVSGTLFTCRYLKIPPNEGLVLAFLLNVKGHVDLLIISLASQNHNSSPKSPVSLYLMHLVEITGKERSNLLYHQKEDDDFSDDEYFGGNDGIEINNIVDAFMAQSHVQVHQITTASKLSSMHEDVCNGAEDVGSAIILLPFHKYLRIDGKMESAKEEIRTINQKVLRHAPCSVAILVDRGLGGSTTTTQLDHNSYGTRQQQQQQQQQQQLIATLFFGGADDREALAYSSRFAMHPDVSLTVVRFLPPSGNNEYNQSQGIEMAVSKDEDEVLMKIETSPSENDTDQAFLSSFHDRYVGTGAVGYVEKYVENGAETVKALGDMKDMFSLFIVGKGGTGHSPLTTGMSDWEECPELGAVGDLLASPDFGISGSVIVIQQHRRPKMDPNDG